MSTLKPLFCLKYPKTKVTTIYNFYLQKFRIAFSAVPLQISGNGNGNTSHTNGNIFMSNYTSTREPGLEILIDEDIVTSV